MPGRPVYCWPKPGGQGSPGGHQELSHEEMTLWAKYMASKTMWSVARQTLTVGVQSIGKATKYLPPKITKYNHPPTKKPRNGNVNPEVHIALNFAATPSTGPSASAGPSQINVPALTLGESLPVKGGDNLVHTVNIVPTSGTGPVCPVVGQSSMQPSLAPTPGKTLPVGDISTPVHATPQNAPDLKSTPPTQPETSRASRLRIILDCRDALTVPSVLDLLTLMDQDNPTPDRNYIDALSELYDFGVEDVLDVFSLPCGLLASLGDLGRERAHQLHEYARDKLLLPLGLLETELKVEAEDEELVAKEEGNGSVIEVGRQRSVVKVEGSSIVEVGGQQTVVKVENSSIVEVGGLRSVVGVESDSSIVEMVMAHTLPQAPDADNKSMDNKEESGEESEEKSREESKEESWPEEDCWTIKNEYEERVLEWLAGVWGAGENEEKESDVSHEV